jgi:hypothetical protein
MLLRYLGSKLAPQSEIMSLKIQLKEGKMEVRKELPKAGAHTDEDGLQLYMCVVCV